MSNLEENFKSVSQRQKILNVLVTSLRRRTQKAGAERTRSLLARFESQCKASTEPEQLLHHTTDLLNAFNPELVFGTGTYIHDNHTLYAFKQMDKGFRSAIEILKQYREPGDIHYIFETATQGKSLVERVVEYTFLESLGLLIGCGISLGAVNTPLAAFESLQSLSSHKHYMEDRLYHYGKEIRKLLDQSTLCTTPVGCEVSCTILRGLPEFGMSISSITKECEQMNAIREIAAWCGDRKGATNELTWFHLSSTNGLAIEFMMGILDGAWVPIFKRRFGAASVRPGDPLLNYREVSYWANAGESSQSVIVFPTLVLTTIQRHDDARENYEAYRDTLTTNASETYVKECTFHTERTLDEAYFPGLQEGDLEKRNAEQVVSRQYAKSKDRFKPLLVVPQLWIWRNGDFIISAHNITPQSKRFKGFAPRERNVRHKGPRTYSAEKADPELQTGLIIADFIQSFGEEMAVSTTWKVPPTLDLFESQVVSILSDVKRYTAVTAEKNEIIFEEEEKFHENLSDFRSELAMIQHILTQQEDILDKLIVDGRKNRAARNASQQQASESKDAPVIDDPSPDWPPPEWIPIIQARDMLKRYQARVQKIDADAERIEKNVQDILNLKRTYVSIQDSHASVRDSHASVLLSVAAVGFAIVTIIFAPLAFLTALFALKIQGFQGLYVKTNDAGQSTDDPAYHSGKLSGIFIGTEILTILGTALLVWVTFRLVGIDLDHFSTMRSEGTQRREDKKKADDAAKAKAEREKEEAQTKRKRKLRRGAEIQTQEKRREEETTQKLGSKEEQMSHARRRYNDADAQIFDVEAQLHEFVANQRVT